MVDDTPPRVPTPKEQIRAHSSLSVNRRYQETLIKHYAAINKWDYRGKLWIIRQIVGYPITREGVWLWRKGSNPIPGWAVDRFLARVRSDLAVLRSLEAALADRALELEKRAYKPKKPKGEKEL